MRDIDEQFVKQLVPYVDLYIRVGEIRTRDDKYTGYSRGWWDGPYGASIPYEEYFKDFYDKHWPDRGLLITGTRFAGIDHEIFAVIIPYKPNTTVPDYEQMQVTTHCTGVT